ncbi:unnamed protein product [Phytophthora fragariaefolia]|uniref:Unnamed protein product n=1 Tax=Phytophthora fragariaefolia TaxID=1490495 RepID=A0A9W7CZJ8_9STRA|nr:unnamed protein product [Phytophthora fragariaefolia]
MAEQAEDHGGGVSGGDMIALGVRGYSCQIFDDPETAWKLHKESHLIAWRGESDSDLRVDRFDARNLLDDRSQFRQLKKRKRRASSDGSSEEKGIDLKNEKESEETEQQLLHRLRFGDYSVEFTPSEATLAAENKFPYQYPDDASDQESDGEAFEPQWTVPDDITLVRCSYPTAVRVLMNTSRWLS